MHARAHVHARPKRTRARARPRPRRRLRLPLGRELLGPLYETEAFGRVLGDASRKNQLFAAAGQNLAERGFDPRTFGL